MPLNARRKSIFSKSQAPPNTVRPKDAATVILVRPCSGRPFEMLLMQRSRNQSFMGGATVFPGGALDPSDLDPALAARSSAMTPRQAMQSLAEPDLSPARSLGLFFAAVRETFEESGVLPGLAPSVQKPDPACRQNLLGKTQTIAELAATSQWRFDFTDFLPYARWITPESEAKRFDTRFFVARLPSGQTPEPDDREMTRLQWLTPAKALAMQVKGRIQLMPPTLKTVTELCRYRSLEDLFSSVSRKTPRLICPKIFISGELFGIKLPNDPQYDDPQAPLDQSRPEPSRVVMRNDHWVVMSARAFSRRTGKRH